MEPDSKLAGGMYSGIGSGLLGLEMPLHPQQQPPNPQASQNPQNVHLHHQSHQLSAFGGHGGGDPDHHPQAPQSGKQSYSFASKPKPTSPNSDEDEAGDGGGDPKRKISPWQRMKWTDNMVRLLIMAVYYIGDEVGSESTDPAAKKKAGGLLQKKGKWKSVSRAMMEKGFYVSPQQCEDKFNDLNKRYKRVNDILGRGTACRVVENQTLLETMEIPPKMKEEARKLLNSKHLFFREMCAYHNSCGHGNPPAGPASSQSTEMAANEPSNLQQQAQPQQPLCYHTSDNSQMAVNSCRNEGEGVKMIKAGSEEEDEEEDDDDDAESEDEEEDEDMEEATDQCRHGQEEDNNDNDNDNDNNNNEDHSSQKRQRKGSVSSLMAQVSSEVVSMMQDGTKSGWEKKQWVRMRLIQLEEQQVKYQYQALELEKQRLKWIKFSSKKEREMERAKLENQRRRLETERMVLLVRHKEMELLDHHRHQTINNRRADPSTITLQDRIE